MHTLDPTLDIVFKLLFGGPKSQQILIALLTAVLQPQSPIAGYRELATTNRLHSIFHVLEIHDHVRFQDAFALHLVELPRIDDPDAVAEALPAVRRWARFLGAHTDEERSKVAKEDPMVNEAQKILVELSSDEEVRRLAEERELALKFWDMELELTREQGREEGEAKGRAQALLRLLSSRNVNLAPEQRKRIENCKDARTLDAWFDRALTLAPGEDPFDL